MVCVGGLSSSTWMKLYWQPTPGLLCCFLPHGDDRVGRGLLPRATWSSLRPSHVHSYFLACVSLSCFSNVPRVGVGGGSHWSLIVHYISANGKLELWFSFLSPCSCDFQGTLCLKWYFLSQVWAKSGGGHAFWAQSAQVEEGEQLEQEQGYAESTRLGRLWGLEQMLWVGSSSFHTPGGSALSEGAWGAQGWGMGENGPGEGWARRRVHLQAWTC